LRSEVEKKPKGKKGASKGITRIRSRGGGANEGLLRGLRNGKGNLKKGRRQEDPRRTTSERIVNASKGGRRPREKKPGAQKRKVGKKKTVTTL